MKNRKLMLAIAGLAVISFASASTRVHAVCYGDCEVWNGTDCVNVTITIPAFSRVPPGKSINIVVSVSPSPLPGGKEISLTIVKDPGTVGSATVSPSTITGTATITVTGGAQSWGSGNTPAPNNMILKAKIGNKQNACAERAFTVCAHPKNMSTSFFHDVDDSDVGLWALMSYESDGGGGYGDLDKVEVRERVEELSRDNPPFTVGGPGVVSGYQPAGPGLDKHWYAKSAIVCGTNGVVRYGQLFEFKCHREGIADIAMPNSGFNIEHVVYLGLGSLTETRHYATKYGQGVSIGVSSSAAGSGSATSPNHQLCP